MDHGARMTKPVVILSLLVATSAFAHHGWSQYDEGRPLVLSGTIQQSSYEHPHGTLSLKTADRTWTVVLAPPSRLQTRGLSRAMLTPGTRASVYGYPNQNDPLEVRAERITINGKTTELR